MFIIRFRIVTDDGQTQTMGAHAIKRDVGKTVSAKHRCLLSGFGLTIPVADAIWVLELGVGDLHPLVTSGPDLPASPVSSRLSTADSPSLSLLSCPAPALSWRRTLLLRQPPLRSTPPSPPPPVGLRRLCWASRVAASSAPRLRRPRCSWCLLRVLLAPPPQHLHL